MSVYRESASQLRCPQCGAGVDDHASQCVFCNAALLAKACPNCFARAFVGHKHCPKCGSELDLAAVGAVRTERKCPRCTHPMSAKEVSDVVIDECEQCLGVFLDQVAIKRVVDDRQHARADAILGVLPRTEATPSLRAGEKLYIKCPVCQNVMNRKLFATGSGVIVDVCRAHGTYFDVGELPLVVDFVMHGGLERAAKKDLERERAELQRKRNELNAASAHRPAGYISNDRTTSTALADLLFDLFFDTW